MIGVIVPAHNEEKYLRHCLDAISIAASHADLNGEKVGVVIVLDDCNDSSDDIVQHYPFDVIAIHAKNVGIARAIGAAHMVASGARWLAFTDADTQVSPTWLVNQLALNKDLVCGSVEVRDWSPHGEYSKLLQNQFQQHYVDADDHRHIHGANLGVSTSAYLSVGGFQALKCSEDVALVEALIANGVEVAWTASPRVYTSARTDARAKGGFGDHLLKILGESLSSSLSKHIEGDAIAIK